jgi:alpha-glucosidase (family GH31 glycosyl hydrolase)
MESTRVVGIGPMKYPRLSLVVVVSALSTLFPLCGTNTLAAPPSPVVSQSASSQTGQIIIGAARFTAITPYCIRLEYSPNNGFVDEPTLFAANRNVSDLKAKISRTTEGVTIDTGKLRLVYKNNGQPFNASNLEVTFAQGAQIKSWKPGQTNTDHLGGPVATLDFLSGPINLPPALLSRDGWAIVDDSGKAIRPNGWIAPRPSGGPLSADIAPKNQDVDWYLFAYGTDYRAAMQSLATVSGRVAMPRREVLSSWYCRFHPYTSNEFRQLVREYAEHDFPLDIMVMDMDWHTKKGISTNRTYNNDPGWTGYTWNRELLPDAEKLIEEFKSQGIFVVLNDHPHDGIRDHEEVYPEFMRLLGQAPAPGRNVLFDAGNRQYMNAFFASAHAPKERADVDFWWLDWQQDPIMPWVTGVPGLRHLPWLNELYFQQSEKAGLRGQIYSRWGGWGDQRHPLQFSGDTHSNWGMLAFEVPFSAVSGNAGCFFWAHDTGGFIASRDPEIYTRWTQFSALSASLRIHSVGVDRRPWLWGKENEDAMRAMYHLRSQLMPYIYTSVRQCYDDAVPLLRPMYFDDPTREEAYHASAQYLLGDNLLAAPIVSPGVGPGKVAKQSVWFPSGAWFNLFTGERFEGNTHSLVTADLNEMPLYARGGVPIPMQPYTPRMATTPISQLRVLCYPGADGQTQTSSLYEDDGRSEEYQKSGFARTPLSYTRRGNSVTIEVGATKGTYKGQLRQRSIVIELPNTTKATAATWQGRKLSTRYDAPSATNFIEIASQPIDRAISIDIACAPLDSKPQRDRAMQRRLRGITGENPPTELSPEQKVMALAARGIGLIRQVDGPNFQDQAPRWTFYAPAGTIENNRILVSSRGGAESTRATTGAPLEVSDSRRARAIPTVRFQSGGESYVLTAGTGRLMSLDNVAPDAKITLSSVEQGYDAEAAIDGEASGWPENPKAEWSSNGEKAGATVRLEWSAPQTIDRVQIFDRPNEVDNVSGGLLSFSDGSTLEVGTLSSRGRMISFPAKTIAWLSFKVTSVSPNTVNAGLAEIAVFRAGTEVGTLYAADNVAGMAKVTSSSSEQGHTPEAAIDAVVAGYPDNPGAEWSTNGEKAGATLRLEWNTPQAVNRVVLFDRPNATDDITAGVLTFSDGSTLDVGALSNAGTEVRFPVKIITSLNFKVTGVSPPTQSAGLAEIAVYRAP